MGSGMIKLLSGPRGTGVHEAGCWNGVNDQRNYRFDFNIFARAIWRRTFV
jgi:hypothetical protein